MHGFHLYSGNTTARSRWVMDRAAIVMRSDSRSRGTGFCTRLFEGPFESLTVVLKGRAFIISHRYLEWIDRFITHSSVRDLKEIMMKVSMNEMFTLEGLKFLSDKRWALNGTTGNDPATQTVPRLEEGGTSNCPVHGVDTDALPTLVESLQFASHTRNCQEEATDE
ncbi:hypothetical protein CEXT_228681 [Caerostris extrusa]|uniref:Uncharacterized protein n=1 Tax=Caerostris extrusa TaxID=172846 RepID=A0AAV4TY17_CAEEX|nr:hypothetical protein CEXT_228681 [Caerostris extrusa]